MCQKSSKWQSGLKMGVFFSEPEFHNRPEWGVFEYSFPDFCKLSAESGINGFIGRKTGLFKPVRLANLHSYAPKYREVGIGLFWGISTSLAETLTFQRSACISVNGSNAPLPCQILLVCVTR
jgi:hypothetical protein